jgi:methyl-accepting chemotaxis protein
MKISIKLTVIMNVLCLISIALVSITLLARSRTSIAGLSEKYTAEMANESAGIIAAFFDSHLYKVETAANVMGQYRHMVPANRRNILNIILEGIAQDNPEIIGVWCVMEPDVLEGDDRQYLGAKGAGPGGRFSPYYYWDDGKIVAGALEDFEDPVAGIYYFLPKNSGNPELLEPFEYNVGGKMILMTSICVPIRSEDKFVGVIGFDLSLNVIQEIVQTKKPFPDAATAVFSNDGITTAHFDESRIGKNMRETEGDMAGPHLNDLVTAVKAGKPYYFSNYIKQVNTDLKIFIVPIMAGTLKNPWSYGIGVMEKTMLAPVYEMLKTSIIISIVVLAFVILAAMLLSRSISKPIIKVADSLKDISEGEGDLTRVIAISSKDEIGSLALYFNKTLEKIKNLIIKVKEEADVLSKIGTDLTSNTNETAAAVNEITTNIRSIKGRVINQSAGVSETHATMEQVVENINKLSCHIENQSSDISQASSAIKEMAANIQSVTNTLVNNSGNVKTLKEASGIGRTGLLNVAEDIQEIARESEGLLEINSVMKNIASQTNLLSMNAATEAAHAGEAGRGFAVVANEIRKLAENSGEQSKTIGTVLKKIKDSIDKIKSSAGDVLVEFEAIDAGIKIVAEQEENILKAMEEQTAGSRQLLDGVGNLNEITLQVRSGSHKMLEGSKEVIQESNNLEKATQEITSGMNEMASGADQINVAVNHVNEISSRNRDGINALIQEVSRFKVE